MQGIKDIALFIFWIDNEKAIALRAAMEEKRQLSKEKQQLISQVNNNSAGKAI